MKMPFSLGPTYAGVLAWPVSRGEAVVWLWGMKRCECRAQRTMALRSCAVSPADGGRIGHESPEAVAKPPQTLVLANEPTSRCRRIRQNAEGFVTGSPAAWDFDSTGDAESHEEGDLYSAAETVCRMSRDKSREGWDSDAASGAESHEAWDSCSAAKSACGMSGDKYHDRWDFDAASDARSHAGWDSCSAVETAYWMSGCKSHHEWDSARMGEAESPDAWDGGLFRQESGGGTVRVTWAQGRFKPDTMTSL